ncbi:MAG: hypothetical protein WCA08_19755 [Desulfoferrobacter sp.]
MTGFIEEIPALAGKYGLKVISIDATDVTLIARLEILPATFIQIYRNSKKNKLNLALVLGNNRIYGFDSEGGITHQHRFEDPRSHIPCEKAPEVEEFIGQSLNLLEGMGLI